MRTISRWLIILAAGLMLTACGGGSSGGGSGSTGGGAFEPPGNGDPQSRIEFQVTRTELPANVTGVPPFIGSPYISEIKVTAFRADGRFVPNGTVLNFNVFPTEVGALSTPDDPETDDINEFLELVESGFNETNSGQIQLYFHAFDTPGTATVRVSLEDENTGNTIVNSTQIEVVKAGSTLLPANISVNRQDDPLFTQGSGGNTSTQFEVVVEDDANEPVPDPVDFNNLQVKLLHDGPQLGASLRGTDANGQVVSGNLIRTATTNGRATFSLHSGDKTGIQTIEISADRADNNVDNGTNEPLSRLLDVTISDGRLFSISLTNPRVNAILVNRIDPDVTADFGTGDIPPDPDGTYSLTVSAVAADKQGNPIVGAPIRFGLLDAPLDGFPLDGSGTFAISGPDGDPVEEKVPFNAPTGQFRTAAGGDSAGPGDTLVLFGEDSPEGDSDHEGVRIVESVLSNRNLRVTQRFNRNDTTGVLVDNGPVIPYAIGRAMHGNIGDSAGGGSAETDQNGVATLRMNFPVSSVGRSVIIWAQGQGEVKQGDGETLIRTVGDVAALTYPGIAPGLLTVSPNQLPANTQVDVLVCVRDAASVPLQGAFIDFNVANPQGAQVTVDGQQGQGTVTPATGSDGCTLATVESSGVTEPMEPIDIQFSLGGLSAVAQIIPPGNTVLEAFPSAFVGDGEKNITLRYVDAGGNPIEGAQLDGQCTSDGEGSIGIVGSIAPTDENGRTQVRVQVNGLDRVGGGGQGQCTFFPAGGPPPDAVVQFSGRDLCNFSPQPAECIDDGDE